MNDNQMMIYIIAQINTLVLAKMDRLKQAFFFLPLLKAMMVMEGLTLLNQVGSRLSEQTFNKEIKRSR